MQDTEGMAEKVLAEFCRCMRVGVSVNFNSYCSHSDFSCGHDVFWKVDCKHLSRVEFDGRPVRAPSDDAIMFAWHLDVLHILFWNSESL